VLSNYIITDAGADFSINPRPATVTADNKSKTYGQVNPALTATVAGAVNEDALNYTLSTTALQLSNVGSYPITVALGSNPNYSLTPTNGTLMIAQANSSTVVVSSLNPATLGQSVTLTVTVSPQFAGTPTGTVQFFDGTTSLGTQTLGSGPVSASVSTSALVVGGHNITAVYSGDTNFKTSTSASLVEKVQYGICLLYDPTRSVKSGATYPIKLYLCDAGGNDVSAPGVVLHATAVTLGSSFTGPPEDSGNANPDADFRYDVTLGPTGGYIFNLKTSGLSGGTFVLQFNAGSDPVPHSVQFGVK
jgi:hypothetical protein